MESGSLFTEYGIQILPRQNNKIQLNIFWEVTPVPIYQESYRNFLFYFPLFSLERIGKLTMNILLSTDRILNKEEAVYE